jgi:putative FmdB family regulatory protein
MPIYAYRCSNCGHAQDALQRMSDPVLTVCPECGQSTYVKQVTAAGFQLKGSGWYVTDFRGDGKAKAAEAAPGDKGEAKSDGKSGDAKGGEGAAKSDGGNGDGAKDSAKKSEGAPAAAPAPAAASPSPAPAPSATPGKTGG